jgi:hypothetical protein
MKNGVKNRTSHIKNRSDDPVEKEDAEADVCRSPPRVDKRRAGKGSDLTPVEGEDAHGHAVSDTEQLVDFHIVGSYPADPGKTRESGEEIGWQEVCDNNRL